jgi:hypothetical protein
MRSGQGHLGDRHPMHNGAVVLSLVSAGGPDLGDTVGVRPPRVLRSPVR